MNRFIPKDMNQVRNMEHYESLGGLGKFMFGWERTIKMMGLRAIYLYPIHWFRLWRITR